jgi:hypothetical protein
MQEKRVEQELKHYPINCATAKGDIRSLEHEKAHVANEIAAGVSAIVPVGAVVGLVSGTEGEDFKVATGEYNKMIDKKIAEIKSRCGL